MKYAIELAYELQEIYRAADDGRDKIFYRAALLTEYKGDNLCVKVFDTRDEAEAAKAKLYRGKKCNVVEYRE